ncbi:MAG: low molecular weight protein-tyrosine-phosphatase [Myxococcales bacterium]|nr:low molecular weight phosphotyrosine protein phosphatase [Polyangiaceae bacterium]MDW8248211.1 low molecular weight protein-tyrosine-phosphatase [Myxococcales bacterium]
MRRILLVCTGNICRSPTAEGVLRARAAARGLREKLHFDSAGLHGYHVGEPPDPRTIRAASARGYDLSSLRARRVTPQDFDRFDLLLGMDSSHVEALRRMAPLGSAAKVEPFDVEDVEDPYYGGPEGFERVLDQIERRAEMLLDAWFPYLLSLGGR